MLQVNQPAPSLVGIALSSNEDSDVPVKICCMHTQSMDAAEDVYDA